MPHSFFAIPITFLAGCSGGPVTSPARDPLIDRGWPPTNDQAPADVAPVDMGPPLPDKDVFVPDEGLMSLDASPSDTDVRDAQVDMMSHEPDASIMPDPDPQEVTEPTDGVEVLLEGRKDLVMMYGTLVVDGETVIHDGELLIHGAEILCVGERLQTPLLDDDGNQVTDENGNLLLREEGDCQEALAASEGRQDPAIPSQDLNLDERATQIETHGTIFPGMVDTHNHSHYNILTEWDTGRRFEEEGYFYSDSGQWRSERAKSVHVGAVSTSSRGDVVGPSTKYGHVLSLIHGVTATFGQVRNQRHLHWGGMRAMEWGRHNIDELGTHIKANISSPCDLTVDQADDYRNHLEENPNHRLMLHVNEGDSDRSIDEIACMFGNNIERNDHSGIGFLSENSPFFGRAVFIHGITLTPDQMIAIRDGHGAVVASPSSNDVLYNRTIDFAALEASGVTYAISPDWNPSGHNSSLKELDYMSRVVLPRQGLEFPNSKLVGKFIWDGAEILGAGDYIGRLEVGLLADLIVVGRRPLENQRNNDEAAYASLIETRGDPEQIRLTMNNGEVYYGDAHLKDRLARNEHCEDLHDPEFAAINLRGIEKFICVSDGPGAPDQRDMTLSQVYARVQEIMQEYADEDPNDEVDAAPPIVTLVGDGENNHPMD